ncbi:MAG: polyprenyl diphosphate synthase [Oscillospiraceae bacterium]|nr:polyprenyl diphosphate synthase [Oscillospiraceae bacterium]
MSELIGAAVPVHIAIIMDGNGRWATRRGLPRTLGHREGAETLKRVARYCKDIGVGYLTVYAFSTENWKRPGDEVSGIIRLLRHYINTFESDPERDRIRVNFIGDIETLNADVQRDFRSISERTRGNRDAINLTIAFNYGARDEIVRAARKAAALAAQGELVPEQLDEAMLSGLLDTRAMPDPDLLIRAGAESRISNFMLWQLAYTELYFTDTLWPDFRDADIDAAVAAYAARQRRFGGLSTGRGGGS